MIKYHVNGKLAVIDSSSIIGIRPKTIGSGSYIATNYASSLEADEETDYFIKTLFAIFTNSSMSRY